MSRYVPILDFASLSQGAIIRHRDSSEAYVVTANYGSRVTAVRSADVTNPLEWELFLIDEQPTSSTGNTGPP